MIVDGGAVSTARLALPGQISGRPERRNMTTPNERDEFERMRLVAQIERARGLVAQYEEHQEFYRRQIEDSRSSWVDWTNGWEVSDERRPASPGTA